MNSNAFENVRQYQQIDSSVNNAKTFKAPSDADFYKRMDRQTLQAYEKYVLAQYQNKTPADAEK